MARDSASLHTSDPATSRAPKRDATIDVAKGIAIILVALGHVERGLVNAGLVEFDGWAGRLDAWLYTFHIPLFMFLAGLFVATSVRRYGLRGFLRRRLVELMWVYVVWQLINTAASVVLANVTNGHATWFDVVALWAPYGAMWFLPSLAVGTLVVAPAWWWAQHRRGRWSTAVLAALLAALTAVSVWLWVPLISWPWDWVRPQLWSFLAMGVVLGHAGLRRALSALPGYALAAVTIVGATVVYLGAGIPGAVPTLLEPVDGTFGAHIAGVAAAWLGTLAVVAASAFIARHARLLTLALAYLGVRSLAIYVSHTNFTAGTRVALGLLGLTTAPLEVVLGVAIGIAGPLVIYAVAGRIHLGWLYRPPSSLSGRTPPAAPRAEPLAAAGGDVGR
ncbi:MAG: acyltransferase family protein [Candidatus Nanopelagicales bacterium]